METAQTLLVIVSGPAATGKTTLAKRLGEMKSLPTICKDDIKESLFNTLGYETPQKVEQLEVATYDLLFYMARTILKSNGSLIIESDVTPDLNEDRVNKLREEFGFRILQIACRTEGKTLVKRFKDRMSTQHPGHYEAYYWEQSEEFRNSLHQGFGRTLDVESEVVTVDTTDFTSIDYDQLTSLINV